MASTRNYPNGFIAAVTCVALVLSFTFLHLVSVSVHGSSVFPRNKENMQQRKTVLGSRPPGCVNKCLNCRPCMATLVVPSNQRKGSSFKPSYNNRGRDDDSYYLLSWKCKCGNKLYQP